MPSSKSTEETLALRVAEAARSVPGVVELSAGDFHAIATPVPGGRVSGVALRAEEVEVGVVARWGEALPRLAAQVRSAVAGVAGGRTVHVHVADVREHAEAPRAPREARGD